MTGAHPALTRAEVLGLTLLSACAGPVVLLYLVAAAGFGVPARAVGAITAAAAGVLLIGGWRATGQPGRRADLAVLLGAITASGAGVVWLAWPSLLPPGSGPDLTHHLLLVDYIERHGSLVRDLREAARLGEMASYTPGLHLLAVASGSVLGVSGFFTVHPVVAFSVAVKFGLFALIVLRLDARDQVRVPLAAAATAWLILLSAFTIDSFSADSFLAQVVAELFAVAMLWAMVVWSQRPSVGSAAIFGLAGMAAFLTWPMWIGPMLVALTLVMLVQRETPPAMKWRHFAIAVVPVLVVAAIHMAGRTTALSIVATSGAVPQPSLASIGWVLPLLAAPGLVVATKTPAGRVIVALAIGLAAQCAALWILARQSGATTPYMALKMAYLAVYPLTAAAALSLARLPRAQVGAWIAALLAIMFAVAHVSTRDRPVPIVAKDLWQAGMCGRATIFPLTTSITSCVMSTRRTGCTSRCSATRALSHDR